MKETQKKNADRKEAAPGFAMHAKVLEQAGHLCAYTSARGNQGRPDGGPITRRDPPAICVSNRDYNVIREVVATSSRCERYPDGDR